MQSSVPSDTLFGRAVAESGFAAALVVLGFGALWAFPVLTSVVGGDIFSSEDRYGTWKTILTRSRSRGDVFAGKIITALLFSSVALVVLAVSSIAAGVLIIGAQPLVNLTGNLMTPTDALARVGLAWASVLPAMFAFTALAVLISVVSRSSAAGIGLPVVAGLALQLAAMVDGPEWVRRLLMTSAFGAWHGLLSEPPYYGPLVHGTLASTAYFVVCLAIAFGALGRREFGG